MLLALVTFPKTTDTLHNMFNAQIVTVYIYLSQKTISYRILKFEIQIL